MSRVKMNQGPKIHIGLNVDKELYEEFKVQADRHQRTMANLLKVIINDFLEKNR